LPIGRLIAYNDIVSKNITKLRHRLHFLSRFAKLGTLLGNHKPVLVLVALSLFLSFLNYQPGTTLSGWDNLHPEFDITLNLQRSLTSTWQKYQGVGLVGGMAHTADLPRQLIVWALVSLQVPTDMVRYLTTFFTLTIGPVGVYYLIQYLLSRHFAKRVTRIAGFVGGLFYLLNLGTIQTFYVPFDAFTWFYGFLPLILLFTLKYLHRPRAKQASHLFLILLLSSPAYYVQTIFISLTLFLLPLILHYLLTDTSWKRAVRSAITIFALFLFSNIYWLAPATYYFVTHSDLTSQSQINQLATPEIQDRNLKYANLWDLSRLRGFWFEYLDYFPDGKYHYLLDTWRDHLDSPIMTTISLVFVAIIALGLFVSLRRRLDHSPQIAIALLLTASVLLGGNLAISQNIPIFGEIFRSPWTKLATPLSLVFAIYFAIGFLFVYDLFIHYLGDKSAKLATFSISILLLAYCSPAFSGQLISPHMRVSLPDSYTELFETMRTLPNGRIANLPQHSLWGWTHHDWNYRGSGFLWYGIRQSIMDRAFDVWHPNNEHYYTQISEAIYSQDADLFRRTLDQYHISYLLIDSSVVSPTGSDTGLDHLDTILESLELSPSHTFDHLSLYQLSDIDSDFVRTSPHAQTQIFDYHKLEDLISTDHQGTTFATHITLDHATDINIPSFHDSEQVTPYEISYRKAGSTIEIIYTPITPTLTIGSDSYHPTSLSFTQSFNLDSSSDNFFISFNNQYTEVQTPTELSSVTKSYSIGHFYLNNHTANTIRIFAGQSSYRRPLYEPFANSPARLCQPDTINRKVEKITTSESISLYTKDAVGCLTASIPTPYSGLHTLSFQYSSPTSTPVNATITDQADSSITLQNDPLKSSGSFLPGRIYAYLDTLNPTFNIIIEANGTDTIQEVNIKHPIYQVYPLLTEQSFRTRSDKSQIITREPGDYQVTLKSPHITGFPNQRIDSQDNLLSSTARNCDVRNTQHFDRHVDLTGITYQSTMANSCDFQNLRNLPHYLGYLIDVDHTLTTGNPPILCLENYQSRRCDIYQRLTSTNQLLLASHTQTGQGYTLHLYNPSYSYQTSQSTLHSINIYPLPISYIRNLTINSDPTDTRIDSIFHPLETWFQTQINKPGSLYLTQSYSPHWLAISLKQAFPPQFEIIASRQYDWYQVFDIPHSGTWHLFFWPQIIGGLALLTTLVSTVFYLTHLRHTSFKKNSVKPTKSLK
jgi:hypothetical protein